ncbi:MAG: dethiobiotin synthetase [Glaciecola sp.]|jgi:dethiobiotin synthetase
MKSVFITGTDTDAGKTYVSVLLLHAINRRGFKSIGFKPIAAGCKQTGQGLRNDDALHLQCAASHKVSYEKVNPIALLPPIAPHIAAAQVGENIDMQHVADTLKQLHDEDADFLLVEGAGGWRLPTLILPLSNGVGGSKCAEVNGTKKVEFLSDFVAKAKLPVILVVGIKLGCLNHAVLTFEQIKRDNCDIVGWFANQVDPSMSCYSENLASLHALLDAPFLGEVKHYQQHMDFTDSQLKHILG